MDDDGTDVPQRTLAQLLEVSILMPRVDWNAVLARLESHPHEAAVQYDDKESYGLFPLQRALRRGFFGDVPPASVVRALVDAHGEAVYSRNAFDQTALYIACHYGCKSEIVRILLEAWPGAARIRNKVHGAIPLNIASGMGDLDTVRHLIRAYPEGVCQRDGVGARSGQDELALHWAVRSGNASPEVVRLLLEEGLKQTVGCGKTGLLERDRRGQRPLDMACRSFMQNLGTRDELLCWNLDSVDGVSDWNWEKVVILARAGSCSSSSGYEMLPALHAVIAAGCPKEVILNSLLLEPDQSTMRDHRGRTAVAVAASTPETHSMVVEELLGPRFFDPRVARMADADGRLPLHAAAEAGWDFEGRMEVLLRAAPQALGTRDVRTRMYPFMLAAVGPQSSLDSTFLLLKADPSLVWNKSEHCHWGDLNDGKLRLGNKEIEESAGIRRCRFRDEETPWLCKRKSRKVDGLP